MRQRKPFLAVILISAILCGATLVVGVRNADSNRAKICDIISIIVAIPAVRPPSPDMEPAQERSYQNYLKFKKLNASFGCSK
jgi:hypothetical protein